MAIARDERSRAARLEKALRVAVTALEKCGEQGGEISKRMMEPEGGGSYHGAAFIRGFTTATVASRALAEIAAALAREGE